MRLSPPVALVVLAGFAPSPSVADWPDFPFVHVEGEARLQVPPEQATIGVSMATFHADSSVALETMQAQVGKVLEVVAAAGIPDNQITAFDLHKSVQRARDERYSQLEILGYEFSRSIEVELTDLDKFASLVADLAAIDNVASVDAYFGLEDPDDIDTRLVQRAAEDARRRAEDMARSMGVTIESVFAISETPMSAIGQTFGLRGDWGAALAMKMDRDRPAVFVPESIDFHKSVNVIFKIREQ
jgi:uncharacterized protein